MYKDRVSTVGRGSSVGNSVSNEPGCATLKDPRSFCLLAIHFHDRDFASRNWLMRVCGGMRSFHVTVHRQDASAEEETQPGHSETYLGEECQISHPSTGRRLPPGLGRVLTRAV